MQDMVAISPDSVLPEPARAELAAALARLRASRGLVVRLSESLAGVVGAAAGAALRGVRPPAALQRRARGLAEIALTQALRVAVLGMRPSGLRSRIEARTSRAAASLSGAVGGFAGMAGFLPDVTVTTLLIMRRIAAIAVEEGEQIADPATRAACLEVFALGGGADDAPWDAREEAELGYWSARLMMQGRPLVMLLSEAGSAYGLRLSQKLALQAVPLVGAAGGALVNGAFMAHYEGLARAHFVIRRIERTYGAAAVRRAAEEVTAEAEAA
jgi:hypothetical protein